MNHQVNHLPPLTDPRRLKALLDYDILDTPPEPGFDDVVATASALCSTPVALVSLVSHDRQWFKAKVGFEACETSLDQSVCAHGLGQTSLLVIPDLSEDPRTRTNSLVTQDPHIRFYAGAPLVTPAGQVIGMLCVIDQTARPNGLTGGQADGLQALARQVVTLMEMRRSLQIRDQFISQQRRIGEEVIAHVGLGDEAWGELERANSHARAAQQGGRIGTFEVDVVSDVITVSPEFCRLYGVEPADRFPATLFEALVLKDDREIASDPTNRRDGTAAQDVEYRIRRASDGQVRWLSRRASFARDKAGVAVTLFGTVHDVTDRRLAELRISALLDLGDRLRNAQAREEAVAVAVEILGRTLEASRAGFAEIDRPSGFVLIGPVWPAEAAADLAGRRRIEAFPVTVETLLRGETQAVANIPAAAWLAADSAAYASVDVRAQIAAPLQGRDDLIGALFVQDNTARTWTREETAFVHSVADRTYAALAKLKAEADQEVLNSELNHRLKNTLAMVQAIAAQTLRRASDRNLVDAFDQRLQALSAAHDLLLARNWAATALTAVITNVVDKLSQGKRVQLDGPDVTLNARAALPASLVIHELTANAMKYGSLSVEDGRVQVTWRVEKGDVVDTLVLVWREVGGPPAVEPTRKGFGSRLIRAGLLGTGAVVVSYRSEGFEAEFRSQLAQAQPT